MAQQPSEATVKRGLALAATPGAVKLLKQGAYHVRGRTATYAVTWHRRGEYWMCSCDSHLRRCSHVIAVEATAQAAAAAAAEKEKMMAETRQQTQMVVRTEAMTPQLARPEPMGDELDGLLKISEKLSRSGLFRKREKIGEAWKESFSPPEDVFLLILAGRDLGLSAAASARHLSLVGNAVCTDAEIMRARLHQFGYEYDIAVSEKQVQFDLLGFGQKGPYVAGQANSPESVTFTLWRRGAPQQKWSATYTIHEAVQAQLTKSRGGYEKNPADMLVARASTRCVRRYAPEVLNKTYLPEELGLEEEYDGNEGTRIVGLTAVGDDGAAPPPAPADDRPPHDADTGEVLEGEWEPAGATDEGADPFGAAPAPEPEAWAWPPVWLQSVSDKLAELGYSEADANAEIDAVTSKQQALALIARLKSEQPRQQQAPAESMDFDEATPTGTVGSRLDAPGDAEAGAPAPEPAPADAPPFGDDDTTDGAPVGQPTPEQADLWAECLASAQSALDGGTVPTDDATATGKVSTWRAHLMEHHGLGYAAQDALCGLFGLGAAREQEQVTMLALLWYLRRVAARQ